ncbi:unnamed protein product [Didymodactylos carnosus]|uniref:Endonuclease/exonuclease/phosphatase domain-containing protein n=1 Tax=Didymodactylos carnosus TaxID=1234261 RepID=A0A815KXN5_9BILA|nr:unnamed protein product [Didymodactylos carnosus]CAF1395739.1 unnamed protein product [Didymodactylos carnosus]CAF3914166.1 unnamed protein product [Didymodactylos carnosus]CAF4289959.1 unnamed protein product [Didymodactylos carnosus]
MKHQIVTYNIRYGSASDGANSWKHRREIFFNSLNEIQPTIMGTQEGEYFQLQEILTALGGNEKWSFVGVGRDDGQEKGEHCAIFYDKTKYESVENGTFWLSDTPNQPSKSWDSTLPRICTWVKLRVKDDKATKPESILVYNVHLDWPSFLARSKSMPLVIDHIDKYARSCRVIVMGDFNNETMDAPEIKIMETNGFLDTYFVRHPDDVKTATFHDFTGHPSSCKIDFIWIYAKVLFNVIDATINKYNEKNKYPSDHFAVTATLE